MRFFPISNRGPGSRAFQTRQQSGTEQCLAPQRRRFRPVLAVLEERTLLTIATVTTLSASAHSLSYGQEEVFQATVTSPEEDGTFANGGTVSFMDGSTNLGTEPLVNGTASLPVILQGGIHVVTAAYSGFGQFAGSSSVTSVCRSSRQSRGTGPSGIAVTTGRPLPPIWASRSRSPWMPTATSLLPIPATIASARSTPPPGSSRRSRGMVNSAIRATADPRPTPSSATSRASQSTSMATSSSPTGMTT